MKVIRVTDCCDCPYYERYDGRTSVYHTCRENNRTVKKDFMILYKFCELQNEEELKNVFIR